MAAINDAITTAYINDVRTPLWDLLLSHFVGEDLRGKSIKMCHMMPFIFAIHYMTIIREYLTHEYAVLPTVEEVKELFDYEAMLACFACKGVYLDDLWLSFGIDAILAPPN
jgi:hypothetical protein